MYDFKLELGRCIDIYTSLQFETLGHLNTKPSKAQVNKRDFVALLCEKCRVL